MCTKLSWSHYRVLLRVENQSAREWYMKEVTEQSWSVNPTIGLTLCSQKSEAVAKYSLLTESKQLFASKYFHYLPTEKELGAELERERAALNQLSDSQEKNID